MMFKGLKGFIKFNEKTTFEGGKAYELSFKETVAELFSLGLVKGNFYQNDKVVIESTMEIMKKALDEDPEWATKCAIYGQEFNSLKLIPTIWLVYLSTLQDKSLFNKAFPRIIKNPKMLYDFLELTRKGGIRQGMGRSVKKAVNFWINNNLNDYHAARYKSKLKDVIKVARPIAVEKIQPYMDYIMNDNEDAFERAKALKDLINSLNNGILDEIIVVKIKKFSMQLEELKHAFGNLSTEQKRIIFEFMIPGLKYNALTSNLVTIERVFAKETRTVRKATEHGVFDQIEVVKSIIPIELIEMVASKLQDYDAYRKSRMLPFGLITANAMTKIPEWKEAIDKVLLKSGRDVFDLDSNVGVRIGVDTSGSMGTKVTSSLSAVDIASLFGAMVFMSIKNASVYAVATLTRKVEIYKKDNLFKVAEIIKSTDVGYGTVFEPLLDNYNGEKYVVLITDGQQSDNLEARWEKLTNKPKGSKLVIWHVAGYNNMISVRNDVVYLKGYSDRLLSVLKNILEDKAGQLDQIEAVRI
ncbi:MAG: RNA-binding protein [Clostridiaceae bacterium]|nr:RNA-binding protein [Clostridiaceae bacterium]